MPWRQLAMKDVVSCDKLRVAANKLLSGDFRMGKPGSAKAGSLESEYIGLQSYTRRIETS